MRLLAMLGLACAHEARWPRRDADGVDRFICLRCGQTVRSKVQFGSAPNAPLEYQSPRVEELHAIA